MQEQAILGALAGTLGLAVGVLLFVPFVAVSYRRHGGFGFPRFVLWAAALVYFMAIWTYTLLPLPDPDAMRCAGVNLDPFELVREIRNAVRRPGDTLTDPAVLQILLNVLLFVPLGFLLRVLGGRGVIVAGLVGLGVSGLIELTQLTGVWGVYPCAYRVFDVDDLLTNTLGAVIGSLMALVVPRRRWGTPKYVDAESPRPVTRGRRFLAMLCDVLGAWLTSLTVTVVLNLALYAVGAEQVRRDTAAIELVGDSVPIVVWLIVVLATGRTIGDLAVQLRYTGGELPVGLARVLRYLGGIGGCLVLLALPGAWGLVAGVFVVLSIVLVLTTPDRRGLPGIVSGQRLVDAREVSEEDTAPRG